MTPHDVSAFPTTDWVLLERARDTSSSREQRDMGELLRRYLPAMAEFLKSHFRVREDKIDDLLQSFVTEKLIQRRLLDQVDRTRGKFRSLLARALSTFLIDTIRHEQSTRRSPPNPLLAIDPAFPASEPLAPPSDNPVNAFESAWAESVMSEAIRRTMDHCHKTGRQRIWDVFEARLFESTADGTSGYSQLVRRFGFQSPAQAANALVTGKRIFSRTLKAVLAEFAGDISSVAIEEELVDFQKIISVSAAH